jgi:hypothetical protein
MPCSFCQSSHQAEFPAEVNIHLHGLRNLKYSGVLMFPKILICLDCGASRFTIPENELARLVGTEEAATGVAA